MATLTNPTPAAAAAFIAAAIIPPVFVEIPVVSSSSQFDRQWNAILTRVVPPPPPPPVRSNPDTCSHRRRTSDDISICAACGCASLPLGVQLQALHQSIRELLTGRLISYELCATDTSTLMMLWQRTCDHAIALRDAHVYHSSGSINSSMAGAPSHPLDIMDRHNSPYVFTYFSYGRDRSSLSSPQLKCYNHDYSNTGPCYRSIEEARLLPPYPQVMMSIWWLLLHLGFPCNSDDAVIKRHFVHRVVDYWTGGHHTREPPYGGIHAIRSRRHARMIRALPPTACGSLHKCITSFVSYAIACGAVIQEQPLPPSIGASSIICI